MGVTLACKKTGSSCDLSYTGFQKFRNKIAHLCCEEFGRVDDKIERYATYKFSSEIGIDVAKKLDKEIEKLIQNKNVSIKIVDFVLQSDCEGSIRYGTCKQIYKHIKDYDDNICYGYAARIDCTRFKDLKALIKECYDNKSDLVWN